MLRQWNEQLGCAKLIRRMERELLVLKKDTRKVVVVVLKLSGFRESGRRKGEVVYIFG